MDRELLHTARDISKAGMPQCRTITIAQETYLAKKYNKSILQVQKRALELGVVPLRYIDQLYDYGIEGQLRLLDAQVGIVGAGGLGGGIAELLARSGVGAIKIFDGDGFSPSNLNRQINAVEHNMGRNKAEEAARRIQILNQGVKIGFLSEYARFEVLEKEFAEMDILIDALDSLTARFILEKAAKKIGIPWVYGAIAGFQGQVALFNGGDFSLTSIYGEIDGSEESDRGLELEVGNPAATPMMVVAVQVQETLKWLAGIGTLMENQLIYIDAEYNMIQIETMV